jgi:hypothetical protein
VGERHVAFGRLALLGLILGLVGASASTAAAAPSRAARYPAKGTYAYETVYAGTYDFSYEVTAQSKSQTVHWTSDDSYTWYFDLLDVFHDDGDNRYSEVRSVGEDASGQADTKRDLTSGNNSDDVDGNCQITSTNKPYRQRRNGTFADSEDNPKVTAYWAVPAYADATAIYSRGWNGYHAAPGVSANCVRTADGQPTRSTIPDGHTLLHSPLATTDRGYDDYAAIAWRDKSVPSCGGDYLTPDAEFFRLWDGKGVVGLRDLPYEKSFHFTKSIGGRMDPGQAPITGATTATCSAHVSYATNVKMTSLTVSHRGSLIPTPNDGGPAPDIDHDTPAAEPSIGRRAERQGRQPPPGRRSRHPERERGSDAARTRFRAQGHRARAVPRHAGDRGGHAGRVRAGDLAAPAGGTTVCRCVRGFIRPDLGQRQDSRPHADPVRRRADSGRPVGVHDASEQAGACARAARPQPRRTRRPRHRRHEDGDDPAAVAVNPRDPGPYAALRHARWP